MAVSTVSPTDGDVSSLLAERAALQAQVDALRADRLAAWPPRAVDWSAREVALLRAWADALKAGDRDAAAAAAHTVTTDLAAARERETQLVAVLNAAAAEVDVVQNEVATMLGS